MHWPETIRRCFEVDRGLYSGHARHEMRQEEFGPIHAVCAYDSEADRVVIVTVYHPDPRRWENYRRRKR